MRWEASRVWKILDPLKPAVNVYTMFGLMLRCCLSFDVSYYFLFHRNADIILLKQSIHLHGISRKGESGVPNRQH
ncbi:hypothetical protein DM02DRAFT_226873 [Periconia macrospinosa]|uniref:Uncharacterized protein n=1 Tax=Periconia macrospinosa TaxID=97972 RepID=A0A2V1E262_9PLEO|nr:hypothetical protein DM02DRAFT_226873 [Periconia macrospinosa]